MATNSSSDLKEELRNNYVSYWFTIGRSILCAPSFALAVALFPPSRYESKLWDLKRRMDSTHLGDPACRKLVAEELVGLKTRYYPLASQPFSAFLKSLDEVRLQQLSLDYLCYTKSAVDLELIRIQPLRYMWNETDQFALYGLGATIMVGSTAKFSADRIHEAPVFSWIKKTPTALLRSVQGCHVAGSNGARWVGICSFVSALPSRLAYPLFLLNVFNFGWNLRGYKVSARLNDVQQ